MRFSRDRRGQSVVVGTVILFGFLIVALGVYQVQVVPTENANVEFEHSQAVEDDFGDLRNDVLRAGSTGSTGSTQVRLGTRYPSRTFFVNPPPVSGSLSTEETGSIRIQNATLGEGARENARRFWNATDPAFETRSIRYDARYNEFRGAPELVYEHSVIAAEFDDAVLLRTGQTAVSDGRISLTALTGSVSESGVERRSVDARAVSASDNTVPVKPVGGEITLELPTAVENASAFADRWNGVLPPNVSAAPNATGEAVQITLENTSAPSYRLALSEVSLDNTGDTEPEYVVRVGPETAAVGEPVTVEVRDRYNNPVPDATVAFDGTNETTDDDGRASFVPTAPDDNLTARINGTSALRYEFVDFDVSEGGGTAANRTFDVEWNVSSDVIDVLVGDSRNISVTVSDTFGNQISNATVDASYSQTDGNTGGEPTLSNPDITNTSGETTVTFDADGTSADDRFELYAASGDDVDTISVNITEPTGGPQFGEFTVSVTQTRGGSGNIQELTGSGRVFNSDPNGDIRLQIYDGGTLVNSTSVGMTDPFEFPVDGANDREYDVRLTLLDGNGNPITGQDCNSTTPISDGNDLDQTDFTCS